MNSSTKLQAFLRLLLNSSHESHALSSTPPNASSLAFFHPVGNEFSTSVPMVCFINVDLLANLSPPLDPEILRELQTLARRIQRFELPRNSIAISTNAPSTPTQTYFIPVTSETFQAILPSAEEREDQTPASASIGSYTNPYSNPFQLVNAFQVLENATPQQSPEELLATLECRVIAWKFIERAIRYQPFNPASQTGVAGGLFVTIGIAAFSVDPTNPTNFIVGAIGSAAAVLGFKYFRHTSNSPHSLTKLKEELVIQEILDIFNDLNQEYGFMPQVAINGRPTNDTSPSLQDIAKALAAFSSHSKEQATIILGIAKQSLSTLSEEYNRRQSASKTRPTAEFNL